jgi:chromosome segregation ATPase
LSTSQKSIKKEALTMIQEMKKTYEGHNVNFDLISLALKGKKIGFEKVIKMITDMSDLLKREQVDDDAKKQYCNSELDSNNDHKVSVQRDIKDLNGNIAENEDAIAQLKTEIAALRDGVSSLDKQVQEAGQQRQQENQEFIQLVTNNNQAKELIEFAKNRMNKFYNPNLYKAPKKRESNTKF